MADSEKASDAKSYLVMEGESWLWKILHDFHMWAMAHMARVSMQ